MLKPLLEIGNGPIIVLFEVLVLRVSLAKLVSSDLTDYILQQALKEHLITVLIIIVTSG